MPASAHLFVPDDMAERGDHKITLRVNGETREVPSDATVDVVLEALGVDPAAASGVAVAVNDEVVRRRAWPDVGLHEGDRVEVITARQGG